MTGQGIGADRFAALNLTLSYPVKSWPVMPADLTKDPQVQGSVKGAINTAANSLQVYYASKDPHFTAASTRIPALNQAMTALQNLVDPAGDCSGNIDAAVFDAGNALTDKGAAQYGDVSALLSDGGDLAMVLSACSAIKDPAVVSATSAFDAVRTAMLKDFQAVDQKAAAQKATADLAFARRTLNTLFNDLNIFSVSPVAVFDTAWTGSGNRIGPGGGVRFELASTVNFTLGYAFNVNGRPGEGKGALFFAIGIRDLFH
jgi:hypothetical protein